MVIIDDDVLEGKPEDGDDDFDVVDIPELDDEELDEKLLSEEVKPETKVAGALYISRADAFSVPILSKERELELIRQYQENGSQRAITELLRAHARIIYKIAGWFDSNETHIDDLVQYGSLGFIKAVERYDHSKGARLSTYSKDWIKMGISSNMSAVANVINMPSRLFLKARSASAVDDPNIKVNAIMAAAPTMPLDAPMSDGNETSLMESIKCNRPTPDAYFHSAKKQEFLSKIVAEAIAVLNSREREIVMLRSGVDPIPGLPFPVIEAQPKADDDQTTEVGEGQTLEAVAERLGITRERVRQIQKGAENKMKMYIRQSPYFRAMMEEFESEGEY